MPIQYIDQILAPSRKSIDLLGDKEIRQSLKLRLAQASRAPRAVIDELRVHNGNAIADVVAIHSYAHCYEIKSDKDSLDRIAKQAQFYDLVFRKVTLVTTAKHFDRVDGVVPVHWGIMLARLDQGKVVFSHARAAGVSAQFDKQLALLTLWKSELAMLAEPIAESSLAKLSRKTLAGFLADKLSVGQISKDIGEQLLNRSLRS
ncbi:MAG: sce7726 family protein [Telluria sp.]|nr:sce7726 family protein [Telluria sp.]